MIPNKRLLELCLIFSIFAHEDNQEGGVVDSEKMVFIVDHSLVNISHSTIQNMTGIDVQFTLGHQPEFSPRLDELYIEELEVFTWQGSYLG